MRWVDDFAADILQAQHDLLALNERAAQPISAANPQARSATVVTNMRSVLSWYRDSGRPLPGYQGKVNLRYLAKEAQLNLRYLDKPGPAKAAVKQMIQQAAVDCGIAAGTILPTEITGQLDGQRWVFRYRIPRRTSSDETVTGRQLHRGRVLVGSS